MESASLLNQADWEHGLTNGQARAAELFGRAETEQKRLGYFHTLKEICQQPWTWLRTCDRMIASRDSLKKDVAGNLNPVPDGLRGSVDSARFPGAALPQELGRRPQTISGRALLLYCGHASR